VHRPGCPPRIVLSLKGLTLLASPCVGTLAEVAAALAPMGGSLVLCDVPEPVARMLKTTGLARTLRVAKSRDHARRLAAGGKAAPQAA
jgi:anti-anti-sigma factor